LAPDPRAGAMAWRDRCNESPLSFLKGTALHFILSASPFSWSCGGKLKEEEEER